MSDDTPRLPEVVVTPAHLLKPMDEDQTLDYTQQQRQWVINKLTKNGTSLPEDTNLELPRGESERLHFFGRDRPARERREGEMGKAIPYPVSHGSVLCPEPAVGRRSVDQGLRDS